MTRFIVCGNIICSTPAKPLAVKKPCSNRRVFSLEVPLKYAKPPLTYADQADLMLRRGFKADKGTLIRNLEDVGYYRLCGYWHPFKQPDESFSPDASLDVVWQRYVFDRQLRLLVMDAIERVEIAMRSSLTFHLTMKHGAFAHEDIRSFPGVSPKVHADFIEKLHELAQRSKETFVAHFRLNYDEFPSLPLWAAAETMTFGNTLTLFKMAEKRIHKDIARPYGVAGAVLESWLLTLNYVRNLCAHHSRLWNRTLAIKPLIPEVRNHPDWHTPTTVQNGRIFAILTLLKFLLARIAPASGWAGRVAALLVEHPDVPVDSMGFPTDWKTHRLWQ